MKTASALSLPGFAIVTLYPTAGDLELAEGGAVHFRFQAATLHRDAAGWVFRGPRGEERRGLELELRELERLWGKWALDPRNAER